MVSKDSGYHWERGENIPFMKGLVFARGVLRKKNGELLLPYQHYDVSKEENDRVKKLGNKNILNCRIPYVETGCLISSDNGKTWKRGEWLNIPLTTILFWTPDPFSCMSYPNLPTEIRYNLILVEIFKHVKR